MFLNPSVTLLSDVDAECHMNAHDVAQNTKVSCAAGNTVATIPIGCVTVSRQYPVRAISLPCTPSAKAIELPRTESHVREKNATTYLSLL